jgi:hypothetical protein
MKNHILSLFSTGHIKKTIILFVIAALLIIFSLIIGISDNLPMIAMLLAGIIILFISVFHPWKKARSYAILSTICLLILILDFLFPFISEGIAMSVGFVCLAGVFAGIIGIFTHLKEWKRLPYSGASLSIVALGILVSTIIPSLKGILAPGTEWILIGIQLLITISLFGIGIMNKREHRVTKAILIIVAVVLIILCIWGFYASRWPTDEIRKTFQTLMIRIYAVMEIIIASLSLYACKLKINFALFAKH